MILFIFKLKTIIFYYINSCQKDYKVLFVFIASMILKD